MQRFSCQPAKYSNTILICVKPHNSRCSCMTAINISLAITELGNASHPVRASLSTGQATVDVITWQCRRSSCTMWLVCLHWLGHALGPLRRAEGLWIWGTSQLAGLRCPSRSSQPGGIKNQQNRLLQLQTGNMVVFADVSNVVLTDLLAASIGARGLSPGLAPLHQRVVDECLQDTAQEKEKSRH